MHKHFILAIIICLLALVGVSSADLLEPELFKRSDPSGRASAEFMLSTYDDEDYKDTILLTISMRTSGRYTYALIDTRDDSIVTAGEDTREVNENKVIFPSKDIDIRIELPARGRSITYKLSGRYVPRNTRKWKAVNYTEYFTVRNINGRIVVE